MVNYAELMGILSRPRPNGSKAFHQTAQSLCGWLAERQIPFQAQKFDLYPYYYESIGIWIIVSRTLLAVSIWLRWGWPSLVIALLGLPGGLLDVALHIPLVTWLGKQSAENILVEFEPPAARQEIVLSAHYDSKTELLDHRQRMFFLKNIRTGIVLSALLGLLGTLDGWLLARGSGGAASVIYGSGILLTLPLLFLAWGLGLNLSTGRLLKPSQGAVDNGAACAILLGLADLLNTETKLAKTSPDFRAPLLQTKVTLALFAGEEVNMQGSRAYTRGRDWPQPAIALNLEVMAQDGEYVFWEQDGSVLRLVATSTGVIELVSSAVSEVTGKAPRPAGPLNSDGASFLAAGIPSATLGTYDKHRVDTGFHRPTDNLDRIVPERLPEGAAILLRLIQKYDQGK